MAIHTKEISKKVVTLVDFLVEPARPKEFEGDNSSVSVSLMIIDLFRVYTSVIF